MEMRADQLRKLVKKLGTSAVAREAGIKVTTLDTWLQTPQASMRQANHEKVVAAVEKLSADDGRVLMVADREYIQVPVYDIRAAAGAGALVEDAAPIDHQVYRANFIHRLTTAAIDLLSVIEVRGDSMEPTIYGGDYVLVDGSVRSISQDGIYILRLDDAVVVKRCHIDFATKAVNVISDNSRYPVSTVKAADRLHVVGRVVLITRALR